LIKIVKFYKIYKNSLKYIEINKNYKKDKKHSLYSEKEHKMTYEKGGAKKL